MSDGELTGFGVRVRKSGAMSYIVRYQAPLKVVSPQAGNGNAYGQASQPSQANAGQSAGQSAGQPSGFDSGALDDEIPF